MPRFIIKLTDEKTNRDFYLMWSSVVDAPITYGMDLGDFREWYRFEYGNQGMNVFEQKIQTVNERGISSWPYYKNLDEAILCNRAGENETQLSKEQLLDKYCINPPIK